MSTFKRFTLGATAAALATGITLAGATLAAAAPSGSLDLGDGVAADLETAIAALSGPVTVTGNSTGGPTVSYTNTGEADQSCIGFTIPYTTIDKLGIGPDSFDTSDLVGALALIGEIEAEGGVSVLHAEDDAPIAYDSEEGKTFRSAITRFALLGGGVPVAAGDTVTWTATAPTTPAAAAVACKPGEDGAMLATELGIDKQVVADQINDKLGPLGSIDSSMISTGSLEAGVSILDLIG